MNYQNDVSNFMILGEQKIASDLNLKNEQTQLYMNLIKEEFEETAKAFEEEDLVEVADGLADMVWVIMGMCNSVGIDFDKIWDCLLYTSPSPRDGSISRMPSSA